ncbi:MAG: PD40 domain-containing protein [Planctomycetes bacterium]|nr:PD40 domain-containing protein [Planctomycetota bacterium]
MNRKWKNPRVKCKSVLDIMLFTALIWFSAKGTIPENDKDSVKYEAENAQFSGRLHKQTGHEGYSGEGFLEGFYGNYRDWATFTVDGGEGGERKITLRYSAGHCSSQCILKINGKEQIVDFATTEESWKLWSHKIISVTLRKGPNTIAIRQKRVEGGFNLDYLAVGTLLTKPYIPQPRLLTPEEKLQVRIKTMANFKKSDVHGLVVVVRNFIKSTHIYTYFNEGFQPGGGLYRFDLDGTFKQLVNAEKGQILDCELSYDGKVILFSWKKDQQTNYDLYQINVDGTGLKQLTTHPSNNFNGIWLPDGGIAFLSDRDSNFAYCHHSSSAVLYRLNLDDHGNPTEAVRLSANYLSDITPHVMSDGKILYCRWEYVDRFQIPCQGLWAQNSDGTGLTHIYGNRILKPATFADAISIPGTHKILTTLTGHGGPISGQIGIIDRAMGVNNTEGIKRILTNGNKYEHPYPINESHFLVSKNGSIIISDYEGEEVVTILNKYQELSGSSLGFYTAVPIKSREREPITGNSLPKDSPQTAKIIMQDVYHGLEKQIEDGILKKGDINAIRIVEVLGKDNKGFNKNRAFCWQFPVVSAGATMEPKKTISTVKVEEDGSAMFEVPALKPLIFLALDAEGRAIHRMRTYAQFMPGETQSCTGCHNDRTRATPVNRRERILALQKPVQKMNGAPWPQGNYAFSYNDTIQPVWDRNCLECHNAKKSSGDLDLSGDRTDLFNVSYDNLVRTGANRNPFLVSC